MAVFDLSRCLLSGLLWQMPAPPDADSIFLWIAVAFPVFCKMVK
jgi:hypothetical protein